MCFWYRLASIELSTTTTMKKKLAVRHLHSPRKNGLVWSFVLGSARSSRCITVLHTPVSLSLSLAPTLSPSLPHVAACSASLSVFLPPSPPVYTYIYLYTRARSAPVPLPPRRAWESLCPPLFSPYVLYVYTPRMRRRSRARRSIGRSRLPSFQRANGRARPTTPGAGPDLWRQF